MITLLSRTKHVRVAGIAGWDLIHLSIASLFFLAESLSGIFIMIASSPVSSMVNTAVASSASGFQTLRSLVHFLEGICDALIVFHSMLLTCLVCAGNLEELLEV